jgi:hypothetical protein
MVFEHVRGLLPEKGSAERVIICHKRSNICKQSIILIFIQTNLITVTVLISRKQQTQIITRVIDNEYIMFRKLYFILKKKSIWNIFLPLCLRMSFHIRDVHPMQILILSSYKSVELLNIYTCTLRITFRMYIDIEVLFLFNERRGKWLDFSSKIGKGGSGYVPIRKKHN